MALDQQAEEQSCQQGSIRLIYSVLPPQRRLVLPHTSYHQLQEPANEASVAIGQSNGAAKK